MSNTEQDIFSDDDIQKIVYGIENGLTIADITNTDNDTLEQLYALAYNFYTSQDYEKAETIFKALCAYKHNEERFWLGLGGSRQGLEKYTEAIDAYSMAGISSLLKNPIPFFYASQCFIKLEDKENALATLKAILAMGDDTNSQHVLCKEKAKEIINLLESNN